LDGELQHHGIKGQRWGVIRTPAQLGHTPSKGKKTSNESEKKLPESNKKKGSLSRLSDEELQKRIDRLNLEKKYRDVVAELNKHETSRVRKILSDSLDRLATGLLNNTVDTMINKAFNKQGKFDIDAWKRRNVDDMDSETISKVAKWYENAEKVSKGQARYNHSPSSTSKLSDSKLDELTRERRKAMKRLGVG
jgi:hypothetical protein